MMSRLESVPRLLAAAALGTLLALPLAACGDGAKELFETAQFEEVQNNREHARKLYRRILRDHPGSPFAARARERLAVLAREGVGGG